MERMIAYCGLDCSACDAYLATVHDDQALREQTAKKWSEWNKVLITPDQINCEGCRADGKKSVYCDGLCPIRRCALEKLEKQKEQEKEKAGGFETCGDCAELDACPKVGAIIRNNPAAYRNLKEKDR